MSEQKSVENLVDPEDFGVKEFLVGGIFKELKFTAATRFRLFQDIPDSEIQTYVSSNGFKLRSVALLLLGKKANGMQLDDLFDELEEIGLMDYELNVIYEWVLKRTLNFMLQEAEVAAKMLTETMPQVIELSNTLTSSQS